jgi:hypothetical protein
MKRGGTKACKNTVFLQLLLTKTVLMGTDNLDLFVLLFYVCSWVHLSSFWGNCDLLLVINIAQHLLHTHIQT